MLFADTQRGRTFSKDPAVVKFGGRYIMYYSLSAEAGAGPAKGKGLGIGIAESDNLDDWRVVGSVTQTDECEKNGICAPGAIVLDGKVHIFYQTYGNREKDAICHAYSTDGINFIKNPTNPVFSPTTDWCCGRAIDADVIPWGDRLMLYFATRDFEFRVQMIGVAAAPLKSAFGRDDFVQQVNRTILRPELDWEKDCIEASAMCQHNGKLFMFYGGAYNNEPQQIGCAVSEDGINFTRVSDKPVMPNGEEGEWNSSESGHPFVFQDDDGKDYLFFQGNNDMGKTWYLSKKEIIWRGDFPTFK